MFVESVRRNRELRAFVGWIGFAAFMFLAGAVCGSNLESAKLELSGYCVECKRSFDQRGTQEIIEYARRCAYVAGYNKEPFYSTVDRTQPSNPLSIEEILAPDDRWIERRRKQAMRVRSREVVSHPVD